jgi:hypothetical protein
VEQRQNVARVSSIPLHLGRQLLATRFEVTEAGRAALRAARERPAVRDALRSLVDDRDCWIDDHGVCRTHDEPCTHERGRFECRSPSRVVC